MHLGISAPRRSWPWRHRKCIRARSTATRNAKSVPTACETRRCYVAANTCFSLAADANFVLQSACVKEIGSAHRECIRDARVASKDIIEKNGLEPDAWSEWLLQRHHANDSTYAKVVQAVVEGYADRVLDGAQLAVGITLVDVGAGEGLVAFCAIDRIGPSLRVTLTDISAPMLRYTESVALQRNVRPQCTFLECAANNLKGIADASVDVVVTRTVLAYVADMKAALGKFFRTLKPGGRLSIAEPIFQDDAYYAAYSGPCRPPVPEHAGP